MISKRNCYERLKKNRRRMRRRKRRDTNSQCVTDSYWNCNLIYRNGSTEVIHQNFK
jgi:hypothetical protein